MSKTSFIRWTKWLYVLAHLKGQCHEIFECWFFSSNSFAESPFHGVRYTAESPFRCVRYTAESLFRGVSYTAEPTFCPISLWIGKKLNRPRVPLRGPGGAYWWKKQLSKISWHCPFKANFLFRGFFTIINTWNNFYHRKEMYR